MQVRELPEDLTQRRFHGVGSEDGTRCLRGRVGWLTAGGGIGRLGGDDGVVEDGEDVVGVGLGVECA